MSFFSVPQYPLPSRNRPEDSRGDIDWGLLFSRLFIYGIIALFIVVMLFALAIVVTLGQILPEPLRDWLL
jgi:hypothetical protein